ncbi:uridine kinase [Arthrobacter jiangjiafuii]|uniref:Uridine kinase n=1 Tax=Arthrobacter jiangjiafuii TaxID=2817475 RepID=A0A975M3P5_9MICC|nr:uridine kinase [Arthrobacter jiangjiafuii]MBP3044583.1 uridine kinase [Arthrobacter jiangjiafuii]QWC09315.1 uridine kinase [Arthrobacter jiangjiafuii]
MTLLPALATRLAAAAPERRVFVAVDGVDGSGKTMFADAVAAEVVSAPDPRPVLRISLDDFHHRRATRYRRGQRSAAGFRLDSYNLEQFRSYVLTPLKPGGSGSFRRAGHDLRTDAVLAPEPEPAAPNAVVLVDGLFLHRRELAPEWDFSVFLDVPFAVSAARMAVRDGSPADPDHPLLQRYVGGQRLYFADSDPALHATVVIENTDPQRPRIISATQASYRGG